MQYCIQCNKLSTCALTRRLGYFCVTGRLRHEAIVDGCRCDNIKRIDLDGIWSNGVRDHTFSRSIRYRVVRLRGGTCKILVLHDLSSNYYVMLMSKLLSRVVPRVEFDVQALASTRFNVVRCLTGSDEIAALVTLLSLGLRDLSYVLLSSRIEDVYIRGREVYVYLNDGTLCTAGRISDSVCQQIIKLANLSGSYVSIENPSVRFSIRLGNYRFRFAVDRWPVVSSLHVHIRIHSRPLTVIDLIESNFLSIELASKIIAAIRSGSNLLVLGETGSGKTTLVNSLDITLDPMLKRVYVDEVDESLELPDTLQIRYRSIRGRLREVLNLLYRGGGVLVIGELRGRDHFRAFKHALLSGLQVITTSHARSLDDFKKKMLDFGVEDVSLEHNFVIVELERRGCRRYVKRVHLNARVESSEELKIMSALKMLLGRSLNHVQFYRMFHRLLEDERSS